MTPKSEKDVEKEVREALELLHTISLDDHTRAKVTLHQKFARLRRRGDWFELGSTELDEIMQIRELNF